MVQKQALAPPPMHKESGEKQGEPFVAPAGHGAGPLVVSKGHT